MDRRYGEQLHFLRSRYIFHAFLILKDFGRNLLTITEQVNIQAFKKESQQRLSEALKATQFLAYRFSLQTIRLFSCPILICLFNDQYNVVSKKILLESQT